MVEDVELDCTGSSSTVPPLICDSGENPPDPSQGCDISEDDDCSFEDNPVDSEIQDSIYSTDVHGPPIVSVLLLKGDKTKIEIEFSYPKEFRSANTSPSNDRLRFADANNWCKHERNLEEELDSCSHLIPELAMGSLKEESLVDFVYFILPTSAGNSFYGISYVARFDKEEDIINNCAEKENDVRDRDDTDFDTGSNTLTGENDENQVMNGGVTSSITSRGEGLQSCSDKREESTIPHDHCSEINGATVTVQNTESQNKYYYVAICIIAKVPFFGLIGHRLEFLALTYFNSHDFSNCNLLVALMEQINSLKSVEEWNYETLYFSLEEYFKPVSLCLSYRTLLFLLKSILVGKKIIIYSECSARASTAVLSLLMMIPGANSLGFNSRGFGSLWHGWNKFGLPLHLFHSKGVLLPYFTSGMLSLLKNVNGYLIGISDSTILNALGNPPDILLDLEAEVFKLNNRELLKLYSLSSYEINYFDTASDHVYDSDSGEDIAKCAIETGKVIFDIIGNYLSKAPKTFVNIGGRIKRIYKRRNNTGRSMRCKETPLQFLDKYFPGVVPSWLMSCGISRHSNHKMVCDSLEMLKFSETVEEPFSIRSMFDKMYKKKGKYKYFGYFENLQLTPNGTDRNREIEYAINSRINPIQEYLLNFLKEAAYLSRNGRCISHLVMDFMFDLDSVSDNSKPVAGLVIKRGDTFIRGSSAVRSSECTQARSNTQDIPEEELEYEIPSVLATKILELQNNYSLDFIELWIQTKCAKRFFRQNRLETFNEPTFCYKQDIAKYNYSNGDFYMGGLVDMLRDGHGCYTTVDGSRYEGGWIRDKRHGIGTLISTKSKYKYTGGWKLDKKHGEGILETTNYEYVGMFKNDLFHGNGKLVMNGGLRYEGDFVSGKFHGYGKLALPDGTVKMGKFKDNELVGICSVISPDGRIYTGKLYRDLKHGTGTLLYNTLVKFCGHWVEGIREGQGLASLQISDDQKDGAITIEGIWKNDRMSLKDVLITFPNGHKFFGNLERFNDSSYFDLMNIDEGDNRIDIFKREFEKLPGRILPHGKGISKSAVGIYSGDFLCGVRFGNGEMVFSNGVIYSGSWEFGTVSGTGTLCFPGETLKHEMTFVKGTMTTSFDSAEYNEQVRRCLSQLEGGIFEKGFTIKNLESTPDLL